MIGNYDLFYSDIKTFLADKMAISDNKTVLDKMCLKSC